MHWSSNCERPAFHPKEMDTACAFRYMISSKEAAKKKKNKKGERTNLELLKVKHLRQQETWTQVWHPNLSQIKHHPRTVAYSWLKWVQSNLILQHWDEIVCKCLCKLQSVWSGGNLNRCICILLLSQRHYWFPVEATWNFACTTTLWIVAPLWSAKYRALEVPDTDLHCSKYLSHSSVEMFTFHISLFFQFSAEPWKRRSCVSC